MPGNSGMRGVRKRTALRTEKRLRYADVYNRAFDAHQSRRLPAFITSAIRRFTKAPVAHIHVPRYITTIIETQGIAKHACNADVPNDKVRWAVQLVRLMERRAARLITHRILQWYYHPKGPWLRRRLCTLSTEYAPIPSYG